MTLDVAAEFVLLNNGPKPTGSALATRRLRADGSDVRVGIDKDGFRHLLLKTPDEMRHEKQSAALSLESRALGIEGSTVLFADLKCSDARLALVFERLVQDVLTRIHAGAPALVALSDALDEWRDLFRAGSSTFTMEQAIGLIGELEVLERISNALGPSSGLDAWWGPDGHSHDFYSPTSRAIEVKATRSLDGNRVHISNISQLDPEGVADLHLAVFKLKPDAGAPSLDERVTSLLAKGFPAAALLAKIEHAGHVYEAPLEFNTRFSIVSDKWWTVDDDFPGVRSSRMSPSAANGVSNIKYELSLDSVGAPLSAEAVERLVSDWVATNE